MEVKRMCISVTQDFEKILKECSRMYGFNNVSSFIRVATFAYMDKMSGVFSEKEGRTYAEYKRKH